MISVLSLIKQLSDRPISFHRAYVKLTGSVNAALMLSQAMYWTPRTTDTDGWFYKSSADWEEETGLGRHEQDTARKQLKRTGFWSEKLKGVPATTHYKIDLEKMASSLTESGKLDCENPASKSAAIQHTIITETTTETTSFTESKDSVPNKSELGSELVLSIEVPNTKKGAKKELLYQACVDFWLKEAHPGWTFGAMHGKSMKALIVKMRTLCFNKQMVGSDAQVLASFKKMCSQLPAWFQDKDLPIINAKFNEIITQIQNGPKQGSFHGKNSADRFSKFAS